MWLSDDAFVVSQLVLRRETSPWLPTNQWHPGFKNLWLQSHWRRHHCGRRPSWSGRGGWWNKSHRSCCEVDACQDLKDFTGLTSEEFGKRMQRRGRFHFEGEHAFWNPNSKTELAWCYASSINYLFANAVHEAAESTIATLASSKEYQPVLEYSGGVGNNVLNLTTSRREPVCSSSSSKPAPPELTFLAAYQTTNACIYKQ